MSQSRAVLSAEQLANIRAPIERASTLPAESYYEDAFYEAERDTVFSRNWVAVLFDFDVASPGDALPFELCGVPLLGVRDAEGTLRVFHNVVPYDGCLAVIEPAHGLKHIETPYHGWLYDLRGTLLATPYWDGSAESDLEALHGHETDLVEVHCETYLHTVFVNLSQTPESFQDYVAPIARQFCEYDLDQIAVATDTSGVPIIPSTVTNANWKIFFDIDGPNVLHEHFVHSDYKNSSLHPRVDKDRNKTYEEIIDGYFIGPRFRHSDFVETYGAVDPAEPHLGRDGRLPDQAGFLDLYPTMSFSIGPGFIEIGINLPLAPDRTVDRRMYLIPLDAATEDKAARREEIYGFFGAVAPEDNRISESVQKAAHSPVYKTRFFSPFWDLMRHQFHQWVAEDLACLDRPSSTEGSEQ
jgi:choline monooxygenase